MIEVHFHCLPGLDDGPETWDESIALCRAAAAEGTKQIVATTHVLRDRWINDDAALRNELLGQLNRLLGGTPEILPGCEYWFGSDMLELLEVGASGPLTCLNGSRYLLVEFAPDYVPQNAEATLYEVVLMGVTPVIAHPERNRVFGSEPQKLSRLVEMGAVVQVTAGSIAGEFGKWSKDVVEEFFRAGLVHAVASDAHDVTHRPPRLTRAREIVRKQWGAEAEEGLFEANPRAIVANLELPWRA